MTDLIVMTKGADTAEVHRSCVADHMRCGWVVSPVEATQTDAQAQAQAKPKTPRKTDPKQTP